MNTLTFHIDRESSQPFDGREYALEVTYQVNKFRPATHTQPAEGGDCEIISVMLDGEEFCLSQSEEDALQITCQKDADERLNDEAEHRAELRRDQLEEEKWI